MKLSVKTITSDNAGIMNTRKIIFYFGKPSRVLHNSEYLPVITTVVLSDDAL